MSAILHLGTITQKGQVTIPIAIRRYLQLHENDKIAFEIRSDEVILKKPTILSLDAVFGAVMPRNRPEDFQTLRDVAIQEHVERSTSLNVKP